ncbi:hypothetical protein [Balneatrix alpica]|uniref:DUF883 domain-containing protein n=1 Tax=Balneatrix alpica TaxID=75684 RepID=A0ABV5ZCW1_9GAMM|nr:hypothetical protein [Balneatrix alpica]
MSKTSTNQIAEQEALSQLKQRGVRQWRQMRKQLRAKGEQTREYIAAEPVKSVLIATAAGALIGALAGRKSRRH